MWCAGFVPKKFVFRILSMTSELSEIVRWKVRYGHEDLGVRVPFCLRERCKSICVLTSVWVHTASYAKVGTGFFFSLFPPASPPNTIVILKFWTLTKTNKKAGGWGGDYSFANVQINSCVCVNMHDCNRSNKFNACPQMSIFYCACVWALLLWPICSKAILIRIFNFQEKSCSKDCLRIWVHLSLFQFFLHFSMIDIMLLVQRNFM